MLTLLKDLDLTLPPQGSALPIDRRAAPQIGDL